MRVGIDLDGVVYDFAASLRYYLVWHRGLDAATLPPPTIWRFWEQWGMREDEWLTHCHEGVNQGVVFAHGAPHEGTREAWVLLREAGHSIHVVTDRSVGRPGEAARATLRWLDRHGLDFDAISFTRDKTVADVEVMIDDKPENCEALRDANVLVWMQNRPWNVGHRWPAIDRVDSLPEFARWVTRWGQAA